MILWTVIYSEKMQGRKRMAEILEEKPKGISYILNKIIAAGFSTAIFFIISLIISEFDLIVTLKF